MNTEFQSCLSHTTEIPRYIKMIDSQIEDIIFMKYLIVVWDLSDMLASTYFFIVTPQNMQLKRKTNSSVEKVNTPAVVAPQKTVTVSKN